MDAEKRGEGMARTGNRSHNAAMPCSHHGSTYVFPQEWRASARQNGWRENHVAFTGRSTFTGHQVRSDRPWRERTAHMSLTIENLLPTGKTADYVSVHQT